MISHALDHLGDDEVGVGEALAVRVRHHVDRHAVDRQREVGAVVGVEAAQEVLVRLAAARVLHHHQPGRDAQDVLHAADRPQLEVAVPDRERRRGADRRCAFTTVSVGGSGGRGRGGRREEGERGRERIVAATARAPPRSTAGASRRRARRRRARPSASTACATAVAGRAQSADMSVASERRTGSMSGGPRTGARRAADGERDRRCAFDERAETDAAVADAGRDQLKRLRDRATPRAEVRASGAVKVVGRWRLVGPRRIGRRIERDGGRRERRRSRRG